MSIIDEKELEKVSGGAGASTPDFDYEVRELVLRNGPQSAPIRASVGGYDYVIRYPGGGGYSYEVFKDGVKIASGGEGDFIM